MSYTCFSSQILMNLEFFNRFSKNTQISKGPGNRSLRNDSLWTGRSGDFPSPVQTGPGAHPAPCTMGTESFPGVERPGRGVDHPPAYSADVKERVELYLYSTSESSWPVLGWPLPLLKYQISWKSFHWEPSCSMRAGGHTRTYIHTYIHTDKESARHDEANSRFSQFCKRA